MAEEISENVEVESTELNDIDDIANAFWKVRTPTRTAPKKEPQRKPALKMPEPSLKRARARNSPKYPCLKVGRQTYGVR